jgi:hypothetical protein
VTRKSGSERCAILAMGRTRSSRQHSTVTARRHAADGGFPSGKSGLAWEIAGEVPYRACPCTHAEWEFNASPPLSSLLISGLHAPQLVPAFNRRPMASILFAPLTISAEI